MRKSIIVTGASSGIGKATVIKLVESGYQVFGLARRYDNLTSIYFELPSSIENKEKQYVAMQCDMTKPERFDEIIKEIAPGRGMLFLMRFRDDLSGYLLIKNSNVYLIM
jgi:NADP-dependent 3-hydroxy acid dehydrogenase YdfG